MNATVQTAADTSTERLTDRLTDRAFVGEADYQSVLQLLIDTHPIVPTGWNWEIRRWLGQRYHNENGDIPPGWSETIRLWETESGRLVGVAHPEGRGDVHFELHPDYRFLQDEMIAWAEAHLAVPAQDGASSRLETFVFDYDAPRRRLLERRGWQRQPWGGVVRRLRFGRWHLPAVDMDAGYTLRSLRQGSVEDCQRIADVLNAGFNRSCHTAQEYLNFMTTSPYYRSDLDLVAVAPDGSFAAFVGMTYDATNRLGIYEPVCTNPDRRRHGLARSLMFEGLHRLAALGATDATVGTGDDLAANALYDSVGFTEAYFGHTWTKETVG